MGRQDLIGQPVDLRRLVDLGHGALFTGLAGMLNLATLPALPMGFRYLRSAATGWSCQRLGLGLSRISV